MDIKRPWSGATKPLDQTDSGSATLRIWHSVSEACALLDIGRTTLYALINDGSLEARKVGRRTFLTDRSLRAFVESRPRLRGAAGGNCDA
jgi:excisionase family DNA binding protein